MNNKANKVERKIKKEKEGIRRKSVQKSLKETNVNGSVNEKCRQNALTKKTLTFPLTKNASLA